MNNQYLLFGFSYGVCAIFLLWAIRGERRRLKFLATVMALMIAGTGVKLFELGPFITNVGVFPAAVIVAGNTLIYFREGRLSVIDTVRLIFISLTIRFLLGGILTLWPTVSGNEVAANAVNLINHQIVIISVASYTAFAASQAVLILFLDITHKWNLMGRILSTSLMVEFIDSVAFFSIAFGRDLSFNELLIIMLTGFAVKFLLGVGFAPIVWYGSVKLEENGRENI